MTLYLYKTGTGTPVLTIENAQSYTADSVTAMDGTVYAPLAEDCELSGKADCSETLRADYRAANPDDKTRMDELETLMAELLYGGKKHDAEAKAPAARGEAQGGRGRDAGGGAGGLSKADGGGTGERDKRGLSQALKLAP